MVVHAGGLVFIKGTSWSKKRNKGKLECVVSCPELVGLVVLLMRLFFLMGCLFQAVLAGAVELPFDREIINRNSLDGMPRSLSIRQQDELWLGYDLERAKVCKVWQAPAGKAGLTKSGFVTKSVGKARFEDKAESSWQLKRGGELKPLNIRYLGCTQREQSFDLRWELLHDAGGIVLSQRVPVGESADSRSVIVEVQVEGLAKGEVLLLPAAFRKTWQLTLLNGDAASVLKGNGWHRLTLP